MQKLREAAKNYGEGLITAREFLMIVAARVGEEWEKADCSEFANELGSVLETGK